MKTKVQRRLKWLNYAKNPARGLWRGLTTLVLCASITIGAVWANPQDKLSDFQEVPEVKSQVVRPAASQPAQASLYAATEADAAVNVHQDIHQSVECVSGGICWGFIDSYPSPAKVISSK